MFLFQGCALEGFHYAFKLAKLPSKNQSTASNYPSNGIVTYFPYALEFCLVITLGMVIVERISARYLIRQNGLIQHLYVCMYVSHAIKSFNDLYLIHVAMWGLP